MSTAAPLPLNELRRLFFDGKTLPENSVPSSILHSWQRCRGLGLPSSGIKLDRLDNQDLQQRKDSNADWLALAKPHIDTLFEHVVDDGHVVVVADKHGVILEESGHPDFLDKAERVSLTPGMDWGEDVRGTNAIGTALSAATVTLVRGSEHYMERNRQLSCVASPIFNPVGDIIGVVDVSGLPRKLGQTQRQAIEATTRLIEQRLFEASTTNATILYLHEDPAQLMTPRAARLAFDSDETLIAANQIAMFRLGLHKSMIGISRFAELLQETLSHWLYRAGQKTTLTRYGQHLYSARVHIAEPAGNRSHLSLPTSAIPEEKRRVTPQPSLPAEEEPHTGLPAPLLSVALKLFEADIPVLILGETGTGKDKFARALHNASSRKQAPFVAVNCAAIPDGLIEAELFGYEEGAFTGARRQGSKGRLREAHGGVLFLDEIGDMPLLLQARLLRVLQERIVIPLGGGQPQMVDIRLICATHRHIKDMAEQGTFRADLYYRLCHYPLRLPPLRQRGDVATIAHYLLNQHGAGQRGITLSSELATAFRRYSWPGNMRELDNLLRTLLALVDDGVTLTVEHLPEPLRESMEETETTRHNSPLQQAQQMLERFGGNASAAARALGISRSTFYRQLHRSKGG